MAKLIKPAKGAKKYEGSKADDAKDNAAQRKLNAKAKARADRGKKG
jgi:hypothetical protein